MRIRRLAIRGFGNLRGEFIFSSDRCNLLLEPNETGKSTLAAAILAGLYGLPRQRATARLLKARDRHRPWTGDAYGLELELECRNRTLSIDRDFARDTVVVRDGRTGKDVTAEFARGKDAVEVGETLCGLGRDEFVRCSFVGQRDIENLRDAVGLTGALQRAASSQQGDVAAAEALDALGRSLQKYRGTMLAEGKVDNEIRRLEEEIGRLSGEVAAMEGRRLRCEHSLLQLEDAARREGRAAESLTRVEDLQALAAAAEAQEALDQARRDVETLAEYRREEATLEKFASFPPELPGRMREIKGRLAELAQRREATARRLQEIEDALGHAESGLAPQGGSPVTAEESARAAARLAVLESVWKERRDRRRAHRREERRLRAEGMDPGRAAGLSSRLAGLTEEDRRFMASHRERLLEVRAALSEAERHKDRLTQAEEGERLIVPLAAHRGKERLALMTLTLGIVLSAVLPFTLSNKLPVLFTVLLAFGGLLWWLMLLEKRPVLGAEEFGTDLQRIQTEVWGHEKELASLQDRLTRLALTLGYESGETLVEDFREMDLLERVSFPLSALETALQDARDRYAAAAGEMAQLMARPGEAPPARITPRVARRFTARLAARASAHSAVARLREEHDAARHEAAALGVDAEMLREEVSRAAAGVFGDASAGEDLEALLGRFEEAAGRRERLERLRAEIVPAIERGNAEPAAHRAERLRKEADVLSRQAEAVAARRAGEPPLLPDRSSREYAEERRKLQEEARRVEAERRRLQDELADVLREYRRDLPQLQAQRAECESALRRARSFRDAVSLASEVLSRQSRESYAEWAAALNEKAGAALGRLSAHYADVRFDTDLTFTVRDVRSGRTFDQKEIEGHLSSGARDQIYLAVRLGLTEYLSGAGASLPIILDDPFATFDDERFARAMEFLLEIVGRRHQIIVLSCHEARHRRWLESAARPLADSVRVIDLTPLTA